MAGVFLLLVVAQVTQGDVSVERDTYKQSRQGLDEMYNEARRQLKEECQLRQVSTKHPANTLLGLTGTYLRVCVVLLSGCGERAGCSGVHETRNGAGNETSREGYS